METRLELAEHYYAVARHLETNARGMLETAEYLNQCASRLCEENMREQQATSGSAGAATE